MIYIFILLHLKSNSCTSRTRLKLVLEYLGAEMKVPETMSYPELSGEAIFTLLGNFQGYIYFSLEC